MKYLLLTMMLLSSTAFAARPRQPSVDSATIMQQANKLAVYASLSADEMRARTDEINDLIGSLQDCIQSHESGLTNDQKKQIIVYIDQYRDAETIQHASSNN